MGEWRYEEPPLRDVLLNCGLENPMGFSQDHSFDTDLTAWEEQADFVDFRLVKIDADALRFGGTSFYRRDDGSLDDHIAMKDGDGVRELHLKYDRR